MKNLLLLIFALVINNQTIHGQEVTIGTQTWMQKNLNVSKYRDGTPIPQVTDPEKWANLTTGAWCYYENKTANGTIYGKLYNWYAVAGIYNAASLANKSLRKKLAPTGWHVPSDEEWTKLTDFLGGIDLAGGKMKSKGKTLWESPNTDATNSSGFTGLPGGFRNGKGAVVHVGTRGYWWSSSDTITTYAWFRSLSYNDGYALRINAKIKRNGFSVRCLRDQVRDQVRAQEVDNEDASIYNTAGIEVKPDFPGGLEKFYEFMGKNFQVPEEEGLKGKIFVTFVVEKDGSLSDIKVLRDIGYGTGKEAIRVLKACPRWVPGEQNGKKVRVLYSLPISIQSAE